MRRPRLPRLGLRESIALTVWLATAIATLLASVLAVTTLERSIVSADWMQTTERTATHQALLGRTNSSAELLQLGQGQFDPVVVIVTDSRANRTKVLGSPELAECLDGYPLQDPANFYVVNCQGAQLVSNTKAVGNQYLTIASLVSLAGREPIGTLRQTLLIGGVLGSMLAALVAWLVAGRVARPVRLAGRTAAAFGDGDTSARLDVRGHDDVALMAEQFNAMADRVGETLTAQRHFVSDTAHELRTPTAALLASASALENPDTRDEAAVMVAPQLRRLSGLTEDLLSLSRFDNAREALRRETVDLVGLVRAAVRGQPVTVRATRPQREATLDPVRVETIVRNLVTNACKYGAAPVVVSLDLRRDPVVIEVTDAGEGVPEAIRETLFDRFVRGDSARSGSGSGLGLAIVREHARLHGGDVSLADDGRTFRVELPETEAPAAARPSPPTGGRLVNQTRWALATLLFSLPVLFGLVLYMGTGLTWPWAAQGLAVLGACLVAWWWLSALLSKGPWWVSLVGTLAVGALGAWMAAANDRVELLVLVVPLCLLLAIDRRLRRG